MQDARQVTSCNLAVVSAYDGFAPIYDAWSADMTEDVDFYVELASEADGPIVELAVGSGRVAIPVAERTGKRIIGIDSSPAMLAVARERTTAVGVDLDCERATCATSRSTSLLRSSTAPAARSSTCRPGATVGACSNGSQRTCAL